MAIPYTPPARFEPIKLIMGPPPGFPSEAGDTLKLTSWNTAGGVVVSIQGDIVTQGGERIQYQERASLGSSAGAGVLSVQLPTGYLLSATVAALSGTIQRGQCWCVVTLVHGNVETTILNGYLTSGASLTYPGAQLTEPVQGRGYIASLTVADPAPGANFSWTVSPTNVLYIVRSVFLELDTSAAVATRRMILTVSRLGPTVTSYYPSTSTQAANLTYQYKFTRRSIPLLNDTLGGVVRSYEDFGEVQLARFDKLGSLIANLDASDQVTGIVIEYEQFINPS